MGKHQVPLEMTSGGRLFNVRELAMAYQNFHLDSVDTEFCLFPSSLCCLT